MTEPAQNLGKDTESQEQRMKIFRRGMTIIIVNGVIVLIALLYSGSGFLE